MVGDKILNLSFRYHFLVGFIGTISVTLAEVLKWKQRIYFVYNNATIDYWANINAYDPTWAGKRAPDEFLYGPLFNFIFYPFTLTPLWLGPFLWNVFSYCVFFYGVYNLPSNYSERVRKKIWLFLLPMLLNNLMYYQYNVLVTAIFLIGFSQLERRNNLSAASLINISALTKIYGGFQFVMLFIYEKPFKNIIKFVIPVFLCLLILPAIHNGFPGIFDVYLNWFKGLTHHADTRTWQSIFYIKLIFSKPPEQVTLIQMGVGILLILIVFWCIPRKTVFAIRTALLAVLMGWMILFSSAPEIGTYLIALSGFLLWYHSEPQKTVMKLLYWLNLIFLVLVPQDVICPKPMMRFFIFDLNLNLIIFSITWILMLWRIFELRLESFSEISLKST